MKKAGKKPHGKEVQARPGAWGRFIRSPWFLSAIVAAGAFVVFVRTLGADFVMWDDDLFIYENPTLSGLSLHNLWLLASNGIFSSSWYTPLLGLRWCITYQYWGLNPTGYHLANLLVHVTGAVLVFWMLRQLLKLSSRMQHVDIAAAIGALLWAVHPMQVEPVCAAVNGNGQAAVFALLSLLCYLRSNEPDVTERRGRWLACSVVAFAASLLSQPLVIGFAVVPVVLDVYPLGRLGGAAGWWRTANGRQALLEKMPFFAVAALDLVTNIIVKVRTPVGGHDIVSLSDFGPLHRLMQAMYIWGHYIWRPWWPFELSPVYTILVSFDPLSVPFIGSAILVSGGLMSLILLRRRWPLGLALGVCYIVLLVPVLGITEHPHYPSDRYNMIVSILWCLLAAVLLADSRLTVRLRKGLCLAAIVAIVGLGCLSFYQTRIWQNSQALFGQMFKTLRNDPYVANTHWLMGEFLVKHGRPEEAIPYFRLSIEIEPRYAGVYNSLGIAYSKLGRSSEAINAFEEAAKLRPDYADALTHLGVIYKKLGRYQDALAVQRQALKARPDSLAACNNLALLIATCPGIKDAAPDEAVQLAARTCMLSGNRNPTYMGTLAAAYASAGRFDEAVNEAKKAISLADATGQPQVSEIIRYHLSFYERRQPYIESVPQASGSGRP